MEEQSIVISGFLYKDEMVVFNPNAIEGVAPEELKPIIVVVNESKIREMADQLEFISEDF